MLLGLNTLAQESVHTITKSEALADVAEFAQILDLQSSYSQVTEYPYQQVLKNIKEDIVSQRSDRVNILFLNQQLTGILHDITDRHGRTKIALRPTEEECASCEYRLPFVLRRLGENIVVLNAMKKDQTYDYYIEDYPYLKSINGLSLKDLIHYTRSRKAPLHARLTRGAKDLSQIALLYYLKNQKSIDERITVVFTNFKKDKTVHLKMTKETIIDDISLEEKMDEIHDELKEQHYQSAIKMLEGNIGYIAIPRMRSYGGTFSKKIQQSFTDFSKAKALIIDLRYNPGGSRTLLQAAAPYIVPKAHSPWVANVAYLRTDNNMLSERQKDSMEGRFLQPYAHFNGSEKTAIDVFNKNFAPKVTLPQGKFSNPYYMVLNSGDNPYPKPIYILVNEHSFSAATVFTAAFKGLPNVNVVGVTPDGSSGNSRRFELSNSSIDVKVSTMVSLQRNGYPLDGYGIWPDIFIDEDTAQVLGKEDTQLKELIKYISRRKMEV